MKEQSSEPAKNRYLILTAGMIIQFCAGIIYLWSVFRRPVEEHLNWESEPSKLTASVMLAMFVLGIILGGRAQDKLGPKKAALIGSVMIGAGMICTAFVTASAPRLVYITYAIVGGLGVGTVYMSTIAAVQKWFPDRRGFASGMIVSAFGLSSVVFAPVIRIMLGQDIDGVFVSGAFSVPAVFLIFGIGFLVICSGFSLLIANPPQGWLPKGYTPGAAGNARQYSPVEIIKTRQFYLLVFGLFFTLPAFFILNPVFVSLGTERGLSPNLAVLGVMLTGIGSASGRLIVSWVSDKTGRKPAMTIVALIVLTASLVMIIAKGLLFLVCIMLVSFGFGGAASVYSAMTAESFGTKYGGMNFGLVMLGFGGSALVFPVISSKLTADGNYTSSFVLAAATCAAAVIIVLLMKNPAKK